MDKTKLKGVVLASVAILIWGSTLVLSKILLAQYSPIQVTTIRFAIAYLTLLAMKPRFLRLSLKENFYYLLMGISGVSLYFFVENVALNYTYASNVSILITFTTVMTAILSHFLGIEKLSRSTVCGSLVAFSGVILVVLNGSFVLKLNPLGDILSLIAAASWAVYSVLSIRHAQEHDQFLSTRRIIFFGLITIIPLFIIEGKGFDFAPLASFDMLGSLLVLSVFGSGLCYVMWNEAFRYVGPVVTNSFVYIEPFITILTAYFILGENISPLAIIGSLLIISGVIISGKKRNTDKKEK